ncbi:MAG: type II toxin-antitoxin system HicA family toxin [Betaproteobacteria bacterium]|nr:type II toxin-antitoxin system HicA family toxin [Betaproteobacteria bacterium]
MPETRGQADFFCGGYLACQRSSRHVFVHAAKAGHLTVPHPKKDLGTGLVQKILRQAGRSCLLGSDLYCA